MAAASIKVYIGEKCIRTFGGNKSAVHGMRVHYTLMSYENFVKVHGPVVTEEEFKTLRVEGYSKKEKPILEHKEFIAQVREEYKVVTQEAEDNILNVLNTTDIKESTLLRKLRLDHHFRCGLKLFANSGEVKIVCIKFKENDLTDFFIETLSCDREVLVMNFKDKKAFSYMWWSLAFDARKYVESYVGAEILELLNLK